MNTLNSDHSTPPPPHLASELVDLQPTLSSTSLASDAVVDLGQSTPSLFSSKEQWPQLVLEQALLTPVYQEAEKNCLSDMDWTPFLQQLKRELQNFLTLSPLSMSMKTQEDKEALIQNFLTHLQLPRHRSQFNQLLDTTKVDQPILDSLPHAVEEAICKLEKGMSRVEQTSAREENSLKDISTSHTMSETGSQLLQENME
ncbi:hypothetical protein HMI54_013257 [Coelomomyces lativittatus]|nr:hypothetical protein HMI54_013257 [Coelomomyces lativittatus]KAJ1515898.1 hypothetical protein HMI56_006502 [Coelomomyces lativittatus]KAJ1516480.1 hypothetical protein HMI55_002167 [Coelomomyces lativittatus]